MAPDARHAYTGFPELRACGAVAQRHVAQQGRASGPDERAGGQVAQNQAGLDVAALESSARTVSIYFPQAYFIPARHFPAPSG